MDKKWSFSVIFGFGVLYLLFLSCISIYVLKSSLDILNMWLSRELFWVFDDPVFNFFNLILEPVDCCDIFMLSIVDYDAD